MKKYFFFLLAAHSSWLIAISQNVGIGTSNPLNKLHVAGGLRVDTLANGTDSGLLRHDKFGVVYGLKFTGNASDVLRGDGTFGSGSSGSVGWLLNGNSGTNPATNFIGTTDNQSLSFRVNNLWAGQLNHITNNYGIGIGALQNNTTGMKNVALGHWALLSNTEGNNNVAIGNDAMRDNKKGSDNTAIGYNALLSNTTQSVQFLGDVSGIQNTAVGSGALYADKFGSYNTATGFEAMALNDGGVHNCAYGNSALRNSQGSSNNGFGFRALYSNGAFYNNAFGSEALSNNTSGNGNSAFGNASMFSNTTGYSNVAIGIHALYHNSIQSNLVAVGDSASYNNTLGSGNTAVGSKALFANQTGSDNVAVGSGALKNNNATGNSALGDGALFKNTTGVNNNALGLASLGNNIQGSNNSAFGSFALENNNGDLNSGFGINALNKNTTGYNNTAVGSSGLYNNTTGQGNVAIGFEALKTNSTGDVNTAIGAQADVIFGNQSNTTLLGHFAKASSSNKVRIGNAAVTVIEGQVAYTYPSDGRFKTNVSEDIKGLDFIMKLRPVSYNFQTKKYEAFMNGGPESTKAFSKLDFTESENLRHNGFIAQEVEKAASEAGYKFDGVIPPKNERDTYGLSYSQFVVPLVKAVQEQQAIIETQQKQIDDLLKRIGTLEKKQ